MQQLIQLRWIAVVGQAATIGVVEYGVGVRLPLDHMVAVLGCLVAFNGASMLRWTGSPRAVSNTELFVALLVDVGMLTAQLYLSGGAGNPFVFLYLLQVILGAVLLDTWSSWTMVGVTCLCFGGLALLSRPLDLPGDPGHGLRSHYVQGLLISFALNAALLALFIKRIDRNLRTRDARLAGLRQRAAEEEHIVRMGLLASGAAHELGTPLSTLSVILGDWRHAPEFENNTELQEELAEMQLQLQRCKSIVSGILLSAGEARGEFSARTTLDAFLRELVREWRATRPSVSFAYDYRLGDDPPIVADSALKQMICNVLDNALEASPRWIGLQVAREGDALGIQISDAGAGFAPGMLAQFGKPYQSSKGRPGGGLGLFLVVNVARTLGGRVTAVNRPEGGARVTLRIPLAAITLDPPPEDGRLPIRADPLHGT
ncbi:MAG: ATP-binding protein [Pseudomonadota bacterium]|nr:ATP-binding protein [Pseudomonadota bacterium]